MNNVVTSKENILEISKKLIREQGVGSVNIRCVAKACEVSVGSIYNYFDCKSDLVAATVESIWSEIFHTAKPQEVPVSFLEYVGWLFDNLKAGCQRYPGFFSLHSMIFAGEEKSKGQELMQRSRKMIRQNLLQVLQSDAQIRPYAFHDGFTQDDVVNLVFSFLICALLEEKFESKTILEMIRRSIYPLSF